MFDPKRYERIRKQKEIQKSNEYYFEFLREALPPGQARDDAFNPHPSPKTRKGWHFQRGV